MTLDLFKIIGVIGFILITYGTILLSSKERKKEYKISWLFALGGSCLLIYSINIKEIIFISLQIIFILSSVRGIIKTKNKK
jgi:lipid-A-disaccharide synthase-like uncharacterized protein